MTKKAGPVECYIHSCPQTDMEDYLETNGFAKGMILFAIPGYGVLFKCRAVGDHLDLEFGAFFSLLRFIKTSLEKEKIKSVRVHSSNPEFVFALSNGSKHLAEHPERKEMLTKALQSAKVEVSYIRRVDNKALISPVEYPSTPENQTPAIKPSPDEQTKMQFKPIQKGILL